MERSILVIEDDRSIQTLLEAVLRHDQSDCTLVCDGQEALAELARREYSAMILDLLLPGMDGFEFLRQLSFTRPDLIPRIVVITAAPEALIHHSQELKKVRSVLRKPLDVNQLCRELRACAALAQMDVGSRPAPEPADSDANP